MAAKEHRLALRVTAEENTLIRRGAEAAHASLTDFSVEAILARAHDALADRRQFPLDPGAWIEFNELLERPVVHKPRLEVLFAAESIFE